MKKEIIINKVDYIDGGVDDFIFWGKTNTGKRVKFFVPQSCIEQLAKQLKIAGSPGHTTWHIHNGHPLPCEVCTNS